jgi:hypothetical protein
MGFKSGLLIGLGIGYVLGTRAGRERYEDIRRSWEQLRGSPPVQRAAEIAKEATADAGRTGLSVVQGAVGRAGAAVRERLGQDGEAP